MRHKATRPRVLVVDDDEGVRSFASKALRFAGYDVMLAASGPEALKIAADPTTFELFVIDLHMPQMRGDELARQLRLRDPDAKVLYLTGYSDHLFQQKEVLWANEAFLEKPTTMQGLGESVSLLLFGHLRGPGGVG